MMHDLPQIRRSKLVSFIDRIYEFYFVEHTKQIVLSACLFVIMISYMAVNVFLLKRPEQTALYETIWLTVLLAVVVPSLYCYSRAKQPRDTTHDVVIFDAMYYRRT